MSDDYPPGEAKAQADNGGIAIGSIHIGGDLSGNVTIGHTTGFTAEEVSALLAEITTTFQQKPFDGRCPYKGLDVFDEEDAGLFFGRERLVQDLVSRVNESRTVFITGPSGSGKSSLVRAGLIHALKQGVIGESKSERWLYATIKPGRDPFEALKNAFSRLKSPELGNYFHQNISKPDVLNECAEAALSERKDQRLVLFVDQFEEIFTQVNREEERAILLDLLTNAATIENGRVILLFAMRSDFVSNCATYPNLNALLNQQFVQIGAMQPDELVSAIAQPALRVGLRIEPDLIAQIINDMQGEPGALPLMQFALKDLFDAQREKGGIIALTLTDYIQRGGIRRSLERHADRTFAELNTQEQELARTIFSGLIEIGRGTQNTKRTALFDELVPATAKPREVEAIVQKLADARLITTDEQAGKDTVTISHEKLIEAWPWLKKLVNENRDVIALQNEITSDAKEWDEQGRDLSYLYRGARLTNVREQLELKKLVLSELARDFFEAGLKAHRDELEAARQTAFQLRRRAIYLTGALIAAVIAVGIAVFFGLQSRQQADISRAGELAALANANLNLDPELSLHLAMRSIEYSYTLQGEDALRRALLAPPVQVTLQGHSGAVYSVGYAHDGKRLITASEDGTARIWDAVTGQELKIFRGHNGAVNYAVFSPNDRFIATAGADNVAIIWDIETGEQLCNSQHEKAVNSITFSPDGKNFATASDDKTVRVWQVATCDEVSLLDHNTAAVRSVTYSPNGRFIATGGYDGNAYVWDALSGTLINSLSNWPEVVNSLVFSPDSQSLLLDSGYGARRWEFLVTNEQVYETIYMGHTWYVTHVNINPADSREAVTASRDHTVRIWNTDSKNLIAVLRGQDGVIYSAAFDPTGDHLATAGADATVRIWNIGEWRKSILTGHTNYVLSAAYRFDGRRIATASQDGTIRIWDTDSGRELKAWQYPGWLASRVSFNPDGSRLVTASDDGTWRIWDADSGEQLFVSEYSNIVHDARFNRDDTRIVTTSRDAFGYIWDANTQKLIAQLKGHTNWIATGVFSPDGKLVATASADHTARLWDAQTGRELQILSGHSDLVLKASFSSDGARIVTASVDGTARIWDVDSGQVLRTLKGHTAEVTDAVFSPDDKLVATSSRDDTVRLWDAETGSEIIQLLGHTSDVMSVTFSPDGRYLLTASFDGTARIYPVSFEDVLEHARSILSARELTCAERVKYLHEQVTCPTQIP